MDWKEFVATLVGYVLSWPVAVFAVALILRRQLSDLVGRVRHVEVGGQKIDFDATLGLAEDLAAASGVGDAETPVDPAMAAAEPDLDPTSEILVAWRDVEEAVQGLSALHLTGAPTRRPRHAVAAARELVNAGLVNSNYADAIAALANLRNEVAHARKLPTGEEAARFHATAKEIIDVSHLLASERAGVVRTQ